jgi:hypothetical protein
VRPGPLGLGPGPRYVGPARFGPACGACSAAWARASATRPQPSSMARAATRSRCASCTTSRTRSASLRDDDRARARSCWSITAATRSHRHAVHESPQHRSVLDIAGQDPGGRPRPGAAEQWKPGAPERRARPGRGAAARTPGVALNTWWSCTPTTADPRRWQPRIPRRRRGGPTFAPMSAVTGPPAPRLAVRPDPSHPNDTGPWCDSRTIGRSGGKASRDPDFPVAPVGADCPYGRQRPARSGRQGGAFPLRHPTPNAVPFAVLDRVGGALADHRASAADCLRASFSGVPLGSAFPIGRKEHRALDMTTSSPQPPQPQRRCSCVLKRFPPSVHLLPRNDDHADASAPRSEASTRQW